MSRQLVVALIATFLSFGSEGESQREKDREREEFVYGTKVKAVISSVYIVLHSGASAELR